MEKLDNGLIEIAYVPSGCQLADVLTKGLPAEQIWNHTGKLGIIDIRYSFTSLRESVVTCIQY